MRGLMRTSVFSSGTGGRGHEIPRLNRTVTGILDRPACHFGAANDLHKDTRRKMENTEVGEGTEGWLARFEFGGLTRTSVFSLGTEGKGHEIPHLNRTVTCILDRPACHFGADVVR